MKIFNWVHRKFIPKDGSSQNAKKDSRIGDVDDQKFIVEKNGFGDVFVDWKGGILTIGTFGYHPLKEDKENGKLDLFEEEDQMVDDEMTDSEEEKEEIDEVKPLVYADYNTHDYEKLLEMKNDEIDRVVSKHDFEIELELDVKKEIRTTLADLFYDDSEKMKKKEVANYEVDDKKMKDEFAKNDHKKHGGLSIQKKLIKGEATRPIQKLNKLIRRMLKRKIHPADLGLNKDEVDSRNNLNVPAHKCGTTDTASFRSTQMPLYNPLDL